MAYIRVKGNTLVASGEIGYDRAGEFVTLCDRFLAQHRAAPGVIDLRAVREMVSPCLAAIYDDARAHRPAEIRVVVPERLAHLFAPGEIEGLFTVEAV